MSASHHGDRPISIDLAELIQRNQRLERFAELATGTARREFPSGRMGAEDDGELTYMMATDDRHRTVVIRFPKPVEWIGLGVREVEELRDQLTERLLYLQGVRS